MTDAIASKPATITDSPIHATLGVTDLAKSRAWYAEKLGWNPVLDFEDTLVYQVGDSFFTLFLTPFAGTARNTVMNWNVTDLRAEVARLRARGVTWEEYDFGEIRTEDGIMADPNGGLTAWFKDPDGNTVGVVQAPNPGPSHALSVMLAAGDLARAKAWYADKLGLEPVAEFGDFVMDYATGDSSFNVYKTEFVGTAKNTVAIWRMKAIADEVARLKRRGLEFNDYEFDDETKTVDGVMYENGVAVTAWFTDSEGNILALAEDRGGLPG